jgi:P22 coat protein - gene protein 5
MANDFSSNFTRKLARVFLEKFESERVLSKNVNTQLLAGKFDPSTGDTVDFKRPTDYVSTRTAAGDITGTRMDIVTGKASGIVQPYFTVVVDYNEADQAIKMDQLDELLAPMATRIKTDLELDFAAFMMRNAGLVSGTVGTSVTKWDHVARAGATMNASGVPMDEMWCYAVNPYTQAKLASDQRSLGAGGPAGTIITEAHKKAIITDNFAGMRVMTANTLASVTMPTMADLSGTLTANPNVTYVTHKDTMVQSLAVGGFTISSTIPKGAVVQITGRNRLNLSTRTLILDETGTPVVYTGVLTADCVIDGAGAGTMLVSGPAIYEAGKAFNTVSSAPVSGDVVTVLNTSASIEQPNLFWHKQAFGIGSVGIKKLYSTDTLATTEDGLQFRVSKYADGDANKQIVRIDFRPAFAVFNPFFAGQSYGFT